MPSRRRRDLTSEEVVRSARTLAQIEEILATSILLTAGKPHGGLSAARRDADALRKHAADLRMIGSRLAAGNAVRKLLSASAKSGTQMARVWLIPQPRNPVFRIFHKRTQSSSSPSSLLLDISLAQLNATYHLFAKGIRFPSTILPCMLAEPSTNSTTTSTDMQTVEQRASEVVHAATPLDSRLNRQYSNAAWP